MARASAVPAGEGAADMHFRRSSAARREAQRQAACSAQRAIVRLSNELMESLRLRSEVEEALALLIGEQVAGRVRVLLPVLRSLCRGEEPDWLSSLRHKVALHAEAEGCPTSPPRTRPRELRGEQEHGCPGTHGVDSKRAPPGSC